MTPPININFISPKNTVYDHMQIDEIHISADALDLKLRDFEHDIKESNSEVISPFIGTISLLGVFATTDFKDALLIPADTWMAMYFIIAAVAFLRFLYVLLTKVPWIRKWVFRKPDLISRNELIRRLKDENKIVDFKTSKFQ